MIIEPTRADQIFKIINELLQTEDLDLLLEYMLVEIRRLVYADAGSVYLVEGAPLKFRHTQNDTLQGKLPFGKKLIYSSFTLPINNKSIAGYSANTGILTNIKDAYNIDVSWPYSFDKHFDELSDYHTQSILTVPIKNIAGRVLGVIQLINALHADKTTRVFTAAEESIVQLFADKIAPAVEHAQMMHAMIRRTNKMLEFHDPYETVGHAERVAAYAVEIYEAWAQKRGIPRREIRRNRALLRMAAMLHDIGKVAVNTDVLKKDDELSVEDRKLKQQHTIYGARLFSNVSAGFEEMARIIALTHHERWDGAGYPGHVNADTGLPLAGREKSAGMALGKSGAEIPIYGRIVALTNAYDTLTYKFRAAEMKQDGQAIKEQAVSAIMDGSGKQFDPDVVRAFAECLDMINALGDRYLGKA